MKGVVIAALLLAVGTPLGRDVRASGYELLVSYPHQVVVIDPNQPDDTGVIPVNGTAEASHLLRDKGVLFLHMPDVNELAVVNVAPFSPDRYQVLASYRSPELGRRGLRFVASGLKIYLARGREAVAILDPATLIARLGLYTFDFLPLVFQDQVIMRQGIFSLQAGQLSYEDPRPRPGALHVPVFVRLGDRPLELLAAPARDRLYLSATRPDATGAILELDSEKREVIHQIVTPWPITSMSWLDNGELAVLSASRRRLGVYDLARRRWARIWTPAVAGTPVRLLPTGMPPAGGPAPEDEP